MTHSFSVSTRPDHFGWVSFGAPKWGALDAYPLERRVSKAFMWMTRQTLSKGRAWTRETLR